MVEGSDSGGPENGPGPKPAASVEVAGGRVRFTVDLRPGETTIVSWKKLLKDANLSESDGPGPSASGPGLEARGGSVSAQLPPLPSAAADQKKETTEDEPHEPHAQDGPNRLSNVIERIERMYAGDGSSDEEDLILDNMPDDDEYDTDDSFIDDAELDDYFQVDNSAIKHDGFFVNRGKLERIEPTPTISMDLQPKKRRRKDLAKGGGSDDGRNPQKVTKMGNKRKTSSSIPKSSTSQFDKEAIPSVDMVVQDSPENLTELLIKKTAEIQVSGDPSGLQNGDGTGTDFKDQQIPGVNPPEKRINKLKGTEPQNTSTQRSNNKIAHVSKSHSGKQLENVDGLDLLIQPKEKGGLVERVDPNVAASNAASPMVKNFLMQKKEGSSSSVRPKSTDLEKAFEELEKIVEQFRPPSMESQDPNQAQSVKRRLPPEIKLMLAKVARIAGSNDGTISKDVINRLMSIMGHLMQLTTLKRNLRAMANMELSAKQEKDDLIQKVKQEVAEMVKSRTVRMKSKLEQHDANSDDFQEAGPVDREALIRKYTMDEVVENKICDLYDLFVERQERHEDSGHPFRKLYEELASFWPSGVMNNDGIRRAIYRSKDRKGLCSSQKDREKIKKKKVSAPKSKDAPNVTHATKTHEKLLSRDHGSTHEKLVSNSVPSVPRVPVAPASGPNLDKPKKEKIKKSISGSNPNPSDKKPSDVLPEKKVKKKPSAEVAEAKLSLEKLAL